MCVKSMHMSIYKINECVYAKKKTPQMTTMILHYYTLNIYRVNVVLFWGFIYIFFTSKPVKCVHIVI